MTGLSRKSSAVRAFVAGAASIAAASLCVSAATAETPRGLQPAPGSSIRSVLLFPIANDSGTAGNSIAPMIDDAVRLRLNTVNRFKVTWFSRLLPTVQRGLEDKDLTEQDVAPPFGDDDKDQPRAAKIAGRMDVDSYFVGNLDTFKVDPSTKTVTIQVTGTLYNTQTGASAKTIGASVTEKPQTASDNVDTVTQAAVNDAAGQIASGINSLPLPAEASTTVTSSQRGHSIGAGGGILIAIAAGAILYAALHHDSSSSSSNSSSSTTTTSNPGNPPSFPYVRGGIRTR